MRLWMQQYSYVTLSFALFLHHQVMHENKVLKRTSVSMKKLDRENPLMSAVSLLTVPSQCTCISDSSNLVVARATTVTPACHVFLKQCNVCDLVYHPFSYKGLSSTSGNRVEHWHHVL